MSPKYAISVTKRQEAKEKSAAVTSILEKYLAPLVEPLDAYLDKRLVQTFLQGTRTLIQARTQAPGLVISELGLSCSVDEKRQQERKGSIGCLLQRNGVRTSFASFSGMKQRSGMKN